MVALRAIVNKRAIFSSVERLQ